MKNMGLVISRKENEKRRALLPADVAQIKHKDHLFFEEHYGDIVGATDDDYIAAGAHVVSRAEAFTKDIICGIKTPEPEERGEHGTGQTLFGWIHAVQGREITDFLCQRKMTGIAWEEMFENGEHAFWRNQEIAGEGAIFHSVLFLGTLPDECNAAIIGKGQCARGAFRALSRLGATVKVYDRKTVANLRNDLPRYDIVVNAVLWDTSRKDRLIYREDLRKMKPGSMIVDISCDCELEIETSRPTSIDDPVYTVDGIIHYAVDHVPALFHKSATAAISAALWKFIDPLVEEASNPVIDGATIIKNGKILDQRIIQFQNR